MSTNPMANLKYLLQSQPPGTVFLSAWLEKQGYSRELQKRYKLSGWFDSIGSGAMIRNGDQVNWLGALYSLQQYAGLNIHVGEKSALIMQNKAHYLELNTKKVILFAPRKTVLPKWFKSYPWPVTLEFYETNFLPVNLGLTPIGEKTFAVKVSNPVRALMEYIYLSSHHFELFEIYQIMESLNTLRPSIVQELLEECRSVKVKRLFMYLAELAEHSWLKYLDLSKINFGKGIRSFATNGIYVPRYKITVPRELFRDKNSLRF